MKLLLLLFIQCGEYSQHPLSQIFAIGLPVEFFFPYNDMEAVLIQILLYSSESYPAPLVMQLACPVFFYREALSVSIPGDAIGLPSVLCGQSVGVVALWNRSLIERRYCLV